MAKVKKPTMVIDGIEFEVNIRRSTWPGPREFYIHRFGTGMKLELWPPAGFNRESSYMAIYKVSRKLANAYTTPGKNNIAETFAKLKRIALQYALIERQKQDEIIKSVE